jgi:hypothetical protein
MIRSLTCLLLLTGCATAPPQWMKVDGKPVKQEQFELDLTACKGEMGCMAGKGYIQRQQP